MQKQTGQHEPDGKLFALIGPHGFRASCCNTYGIDMSQKKDEKHKIAAGIAVDSPPSPLYFPVSLMKLAVMSICTFGLYQLYWFYKNWSLVREREGLNIAPMLRAYFASFFCYSLFTRIQDTAEAQELRVTLASGFLAAGWIVLTLLIALPDPYWLITFLSVIFLLPVQSVVNDINREVSPKHDAEAGFSRMSMTLAIFGGILFVLAAVETIFPHVIAESLFQLD